MRRVALIVASGLVLASCGSGPREPDATLADMLDPHWWTVTRIIAAVFVVGWLLSFLKDMIRD